MSRPDLPSTPHYIAWYAARTPDSIVIAEDGRFVTWRQFATDLAGTVRALEAFGARPDALIGVEHPRRYQHLLLLLVVQLVVVVVLLVLLPLH